MYKIPFFIGNMLACFVPNNLRRARFRGYVNILLFRPSIRRFMRTEFQEKLKTVKFVRQHTLNRVVCLVNDKYYIKIFRNITVKQLKDFKFLMDIVRPCIGVHVPDVVVDSRIPMYACEKMVGHSISCFNSNFVMKNENKILRQVAKIIDALQKIDLQKIPDVKRFELSMQPKRTKEKSCKKCHPVLAHFDMNETNFLFDDDLNICGVIDWDTIAIAKNPNTDKEIFIKYWEKYKDRMRRAGLYRK